jgi:predicted nucleic-acid-binding protein
VIAIDANIVVRLLTRDDQAQYQASYQLFRTAEIFIPDTVILETEWVLRYAYDFKPAEICSAFKKLFGLKNVHVNNAQLVARVINWHEAGLDFADAFHLANSERYSSLQTFDERFIKKAGGLSDCLVGKP